MYLIYDVLYDCAAWGELLVRAASVSDVHKSSYAWSTQVKPFWRHTPTAALETCAFIMLDNNLLGCPQRCFTTVPRFGAWEWEQVYMGEACSRVLLAESSVEVVWTYISFFHPFCIGRMSVEIKKNVWYQEPVPGPLVCLYINYVYKAIYVPVIYVANPQIINSLSSQCDATKGQFSPKCLDSRSIFSLYRNLVNFHIYLYFNSSCQYCKYVSELLRN